MGKLFLLPALGVFALNTAALPQNVTPRSASFEIAQHGHTVGTATFRVAKTPDGFDSTSLVKVAMQGLDYALSKNEELSAANELDHVQLNATVNGEAVNVVAKPDAAQVLMNISAEGKSSTTRLQAHNNAVFLPDFDPGHWRRCWRLQRQRTIAIFGRFCPKNRERLNRCSWQPTPTRMERSTASTLRYITWWRRSAARIPTCFQGPKTSCCKRSCRRRVLH